MHLSISCNLPRALFGGKNARGALIGLCPLGEGRGLLCFGQPSVGMELSLAASAPCLVGAMQGPGALRACLLGMGRLSMLQLASRLDFHFLSGWHDESFEDQTH